MLILQPNSELARLGIPTLPMLPDREFCFAMQKIKARIIPSADMQYVTERAILRGLLVVLWNDGSWLECAAPVG
jgi:hypothetical protein